MWTVFVFFIVLWHLNEIYWSGCTLSNVTALERWWNYVLTISIADRYAASRLLIFTAHEGKLPYTRMLHIFLWYLDNWMNVKMRRALHTHHSPVHELECWRPDPVWHILELCHSGQQVGVVLYFHWDFVFLSTVHSWISGENSFGVFLSAFPSHFGRCVAELISPPKPFILCSFVMMHNQSNRVVYSREQLINNAKAEIIPRLKSEIAEELKRTKREKEKVQTISSIHHNGQCEIVS